MKPVEQAADPALQQELYAKRQKIYPRQVHGLFAALRIAAAWFLLGIYYLTPWLQWQGHQAILLDLPHRRFHLFGLTLFPQDFILVTALLITAALSLFMFTALAGRLWCGYACPQTVWTEAFLWMERLVEGGRQQQLALARAPLSLHKVLVKGTKHLLWVVFAAWTGYTFVGYFVPIRELGIELATFTAGPWAVFWTFFYGFATYLNAGWMREQVCIYMCPYARFQSAMFDKDTLVIAYDRKRGEPRGSRKRGVDPRTLGLGDCIDCRMCVQVCPTGIDIRDGLQYQCIACASCVDVCDDVMDKMGYPKGLVRYTTERAEEEGGRLRLLRPRIIIYATLLLVLLTAIGGTLALRTPLRLDVIRDRQSLFRETSEGLVENVYTLRMVNMDNAMHRYRLTVDAPAGIALAPEVAPELSLAPYEIRALPVVLRADPAGLPGAITDVTFVLQAEDAPRLRRQTESRFIGPAP